MLRLGIRIVKTISYTRIWVKITKISFFPHTSFEHDTSLYYWYLLPSHGIKTVGERRVVVVYKSNNTSRSCIVFVGIARAYNTMASFCDDGRHRSRALRAAFFSFFNTVQRVNSMDGYKTNTGSRPNPSVLSRLVLLTVDTRRLSPAVVSPTPPQSPARDLPQRYPMTVSQ